jgi:hypothetical protein
VLAAARGVQVTALHLIAQPLLRSAGGLHAPTDVIREHLAHAEACLVSEAVAWGIRFCILAIAQVMTSGELIGRT